MSISEKVITIAQEARQASLAMARLSTATKNTMLLKMADALEQATSELIEENRKDLDAGQQKGLSAAMLDRLMLDEKRIRGIADALREVAALPDPVGEVTKMWKRPNELMVGKMRIPLGTIGIIYESRPNVTADAAALCLKAGNAVVLRGGSEAIQFQSGHCRNSAGRPERNGYPSGGAIADSFHRTRRGAGDAQAGRVHRPDHPARRRKPDPVCGRELAYPGDQALQGGLPYFCRSVG